MLPKYVIITAAGTGVRMNTPMPKQFIPVLGKPILMHTIEAFVPFLPSIHIILVLPKEQMEYWNQLCTQYQFDHPHEVIQGGPTRFHSVKNGLNQVPEQALVAVHDGVRPLVSSHTISGAFLYAEKSGNGIPSIEVCESVRAVDRAFSTPVDRETLRIIQTPQCFRAELIKKAYHTNYQQTFTDDASVLEQTGERIFLSQGNRENIKITTPEDLIMAEALLKNRVEGAQG